MGTALGAPPPRWPADPRAPAPASPSSPRPRSGPLVRLRPAQAPRGCASVSALPRGTPAFSPGDSSPSCPCSGFQVSTSLPSPPPVIAPHAYYTYCIMFIPHRQRQETEDDEGRRACTHGSSSVRGSAGCPPSKPAPRDTPPTPQGSIPAAGLPPPHQAHTCQPMPGRQESREGAELRATPSHRPGGQHRRGESEHLGQVDHILAPQLHGSPPTAAPLAEGFPPGQISSPASWPRGPPVPAPVTSALGSGVQPRAPLHPLTPGPPGRHAPHSPGPSPPSKHLDHVLKNHMGKRKNRPMICFHPQNTADPRVQGFHTTNQRSGPLDANELP